MSTRLGDALDFQAQALVLRAERQRVIAGNIANVDTPGYVARELDFASALRAATAGSASRPGGSAPAAAGGLASTRGGHIATPVPTTALASSPLGSTTLSYAVSAQTSLDRNTVDMDRERASFADNAVKYEATLRFLSGAVKTQLSAITGQ
jgi:flagellar basal-body rod protein FlgB